jgi:predicted ATP-grasp superfamily ATP-dependent carboligase
MQSRRKILILGNYRNALTVARQLGEQNKVILGGAGGAGRVERSRFIAEVWPLPDTDSDGFVAALESLLQDSTAMPILFPIGDAELHALLTVPGVRDGRVTAVMPAPEIVEACLDKAVSLSLADDLQIPQAAYRKVTQLSDLAEAVKGLGFPCIIKSDHQLSLAFGKKVCQVSDPEDLAALIDDATEPQHGLIVQAVATGLRHNVYFAAERGCLIGAMQARVTRTNVFDGSGFTVESVSVPLSDALQGYTEQLVESLQYHGIGNTQFLLDPQQGGISFLEISPRMGAAFALTAACGFDFSRAGLNLATGEPLSADILPRDYQIGRRFAWSYGDVVGLISAVRSREISTSESAKWLWHIVRSAVYADIHATWSWQDPRPALANVSAAVRKFSMRSGS